MRAAVIDEMKRCKPRLAAVVAKDHLRAPSILCGEPLRGQEGVEHLEGQRVRSKRLIETADGLSHLEIDRHVPNALGAEGARVVVSDVGGEAAAVHQVAAGQLLDGVDAVKQALGAD